VADTEEIVNILSKFKLQDHAEKFFSVQKLLHIKVSTHAAAGTTQGWRLQET